MFTELFAAFHQKRGWTADFFSAMSYSLSFCVFMGGYAVKIFSSENLILWCFKLLLRRSTRQRCRWAFWSASDSRCTFLRLKTFSRRSCWAMRHTELHDIQISFSISLGLFPVTGSFSCLQSADEICYEVNVGLTERGRPLPCLRDIDDIWSIFYSNILTAIRKHCLFGNSCKILLAPHCFYSSKSFIAALSSFVSNIVYVYVSSLLTSLLTSLCFSVKWVH